MDAYYLDSFVPRTGDKNATLRRLEPFDDLDRGVVLGDLLRLSSLNVVKTRSVVTTTRNNLVPFLWSVIGRMQTVFSEKYVLTLFQQTDSTGPWCPYIAFPCVWPFCPTSYIRTYEDR